MKNKFMYAVKACRARLLALAVVLCALMGQAQEVDPLGVLTTFDASTASATIRTIMLTVLGIVAAIYGVKMGFVVLSWVYRQVTGKLAGRG